MSQSVHIITCQSCGASFTESALDYKWVDVEEEHGVGSLFHDHHQEMRSICPECGSEDLKERFLDASDVVDILNELKENKQNEKDPR